MTVHIPGLDKSLLKRLGDKFKASQPPYFNSFTARTGKVGSDGVLESDPTSGLPPGYIWIRAALNNDSSDSTIISRAAVPAINLVRSDYADSPVKCGYTSPNAGGDLVAYDVNATAETVAQYQTYLAALRTPNTPAEIQNHTFPAGLILDGLVSKSPSGGLNIAIQSFNHEAGQFTGLSAFDVSGSVPGSSDERRWVIVSIDPTSNTGDNAAAVTLTNGTAVTTPLALYKTSDDVAAAIAIPIGNIRLAAMILEQGQTAVDDSTVIEDQRLWLNQSNAGTGFYQTVQDNGVDQSQEIKLNFIGATVTDNPGNNSTDITIASGGAADYILIRDQQTTGVDDGTFTSGAWRTRVLNTIVNDAGGHAALSGNQITLDAGTYRMVASAPCYYVDNHAARLRNVTDSADVLLGTSEVAGSAGGNMTTNRSLIIGRFTVAAGKALEIQHQCGTTRATDGFGHAAGFQTEIYTVVELWKE